jgi:hypothetical protein
MAKYLFAKILNLAAVCNSFMIFFIWHFSTVLILFNINSALLLPTYSCYREFPYSMPVPLHNLLLSSRLETLEKNRGSRIRHMLGLKQKIFRSPFAFIQLELIPLEHASKNQFDFMARKPSSWAGMSATAKKHLRVAHRRQLILFVIFW